MSQKVILGIDTVRYNLIEELTQNNVAPNIKRIMKHGTLKRMSSFIFELLFAQAILSQHEKDGSCFERTLPLTANGVGNVMLSSKWHLL